MLDGRELSPAELAQIRKHIEKLETIDVVSPEMHMLIAEQWPELLAKIRPAKGNLARLAAGTPKNSFGPPLENQTTLF